MKIALISYRNDFNLIPFEEVCFLKEGYENMQKNQILKFENWERPLYDIREYTFKEHNIVALYYSNNCWYLFVVELNYLKGHWTTSASSKFFSEKVEIFIPLEVYTYSDRMLNLTCSSNLITKICEF